MNRITKINRLMFTRNSFAMRGIAVYTVLHSKQIGITVVIQLHRVLTLTICVMFSIMLVAMFML
jgi:hypothetical protein